MSDDRPRPKYGELAPEGWNWNGAPSTNSSTEQPANESENLAPPAAGRPINAADRASTVLLLVLGVLISTSMIPALFNFNVTLGQAFAQQGYGAYTPTDTASTIGVVAGIATIVIQLATIAVSVLLIIRRRLSFYAPLTAGALTFVLWIVCMYFAIANDPAFLQAYPGAG